MPQCPSQVKSKNAFTFPKYSGKIAANISYNPISNMADTKNIIVLGKRILVEKESIDSGGLKLTPTMEADGEKNKGKVLAVGDISAKLQMKGLKVGATVVFKKHFVPNHVEGEVPMVFVETDDVLAIL